MASENSAHRQVGHGGFSVFFFVWTDSWDELFRRTGHYWGGIIRLQNDVEMLEQLFSEAYGGFVRHNAQGLGMKPTIDAVGRFFSHTRNRQWYFADREVANDAVWVETLSLNTGFEPTCGYSNAE